MSSMRTIKIGDSRVLESRESADGITIRRRREAPDGKRFTTYERIEYPNLAVIKKDGVRELFDRENSGKVRFWQCDITKLKMANHGIHICVNLEGLLQKHLT